MKASKLFKLNYEIPDGVSITVNRGGTSCFDGNQKVRTLTGVKSIKDLTTTDLVKTFDHKRGVICYRRVIQLHKFENDKPTLKVTLKNGHTIIATEDHKFWFNGRWVSLKQIVSLLDGDMEKNTRI